MIHREPRTETVEPDWKNLLHRLICRARRRHLPVAPDELPGLAGLALAQARDYFDPRQATCTLHVWALHQGWRLLLAEVRNHRRRTHIREIPFSSLEQNRDRTPGDGGIDNVLQALHHRDLSESPAAAMLQKLTFEQRQLVVLRLFGCTFEEIADRYGVSCETVRKRINDIRRTLRNERRCNCA